MRLETSLVPQLTLDGSSLRLGDVVAVARRTGPLTVRLSAAAAAAVEAGNAVKRELLEQQIPIYGVTTGFGDSCVRQVSSEKARRLQRNLVLCHLNGVGPIAADDVTRATMLIRANCLATGASGVRAELVEAILQRLAA